MRGPSIRHSVSSALHLPLSISPFLHPSLSHSPALAFSLPAFPSSHSRQFFSQAANTRGYNMGTRLVEDLLARTGLGRCASFAETAEVVSKVAFRSFLNIAPSVSFPQPSGPSPAGIAPGQVAEFVLTFDDNPLAEFADLPRDAREGGLWFSNVYAGVVRGALEMVSRPSSVACGGGTVPMPKRCGGLDRVGTVMNRRGRCQLPGLLGVECQLRFAPELRLRQKRIPPPAKPPCPSLTQSR